MSEQDDILTLAMVKAEVDLMRGELREQTEATKALVDAWNTAAGLARFVKWVSSVVTGLGVLYLFVRHGFASPKNG